MTDWRRTLTGARRVLLATALSIGLVMLGGVGGMAGASATPRFASAQMWTAAPTTASNQPAVSLVSDDNGACALLKSGGVECWGNNSDGQLGNASKEAYSDAPVAVKGLTGVASLVSDGDGYCAVLKSTEVRCWGYNNGAFPGGAPGEAAGLLGNGSNETFSAVPVAVKALTGVKSLVSDRDAYGSAFGFCALLEPGKVKCWGSNVAYMGGGLSGSGLLGDGSDQTSSSVPVAVKGLTGAVKNLASDQAGYCALLTTGTAECWGDNDYDELGDGLLGALGSGGSSSSNVAVAVKGLSGAKSIVSDGYGYCALLSSDGAECWGNNSFGELGNGTKPNPNADYGSDVAVAVKDLAGALSLGSTDYAYCALLGNHSAKCWGYNTADQLGDGISSATQTYSDLPVVVKGLTGAVSLTGGGDNGFTGSGYTYCARLQSGGADCWGDNGYGMLGSGDTSEDYSDVAVTVKGLKGTTVVDVGTGNVCAVVTSGGAECWGDNGYGQLGSGSLTVANSYVPVTVVGLGPR